MHQRIVTYPYLFYFIGVLNLPSKRIGIVLQELFRVTFLETDALQLRQVRKGERATELPREFVVCQRRLPSIGRAADGQRISDEVL